MDTTIIIPSYNYARFVEDAIESALNQTVKTNIIVINDGSTDNTEEVCKQYGKKIKYLYHENKGLCHTRNRGIELANTPYIVCLDADDTLDEKYVEECERKMKYGYDIVTTPFQEFGLSNNIYIINKYNLTYKSFEYANRIHVTSMFKKEYWKKVGGYDPRMKEYTGFEGWEDYLFWRKMLKKGAKIGITTNTKLNYRKHGVSMIDGTVDIRRQLKMREYMERALNEL